VKAASAIGFACRTSWSLVIATIVVALLAIVAVWISGLPFWARMLSVPWISAWAGAALAGLWFPRVRSLVWQADGTARIGVHDRRTNRTEEVQGAVHAARVMGPLIVLVLRWPPRERATLWLLPGNLDVDTRRRLRMRLGAAGSAGLASGNADSG
jgi:toxin CptA